MDNYHVRRGITKTCKNCGEEFYDPPSGHRVCCSKECGSKHRLNEQRKLIDAGLYRCSSCKQNKSSESFAKNASRKTGLQSTCRECFAKHNKGKKKLRRDQSLLRLYGVTPRQYAQMKRKQRGRCLICNRRPLNALCVDHCHTTGKVRGLLCRDCNRGLGDFKDMVSRLRSAIEYLESA